MDHKTDIQNAVYKFLRSEDTEKNKTLVKVIGDAHEQVLLLAYRGIGLGYNKPSVNIIINTKV